MSTLWIAVVYAVLRHPVTAIRALFAAWRSEPRSNRRKNQNRETLAEHFGMTRDELDDLLREMSE